MANSNKPLIFPPETYALAVITSTESFVGLISNAAIIVAISLGRKHNKTPTDIMILNLSVADLLPCVSYLPWLTYQLIRGFHTRPASIFFDTLYCLSLHCSGNAVLAVTLDRFIAVCFSLRYKSIMTPRKTMLLTFMVWLCSPILTVVVLISDYLDFWNKLILIYLILIFLEVSSILVLNGIIFHQARKQAQTVNVRDFNASNISATKLQKLARLVKSANGTVSISLLYFLTLMPCVISTFVLSIKNISKDDEVARTWRAIVGCVAFLNSCINPFVYSLGNSQFRKMLFRVINLLRQAW